MAYRPYHCMKYTAFPIYRSLCICCRSRDKNLLYNLTLPADENGTIALLGQNREDYTGTGNSRV